MNTLEIINRSTVLQDEEAASWLPALQEQVTNHAGPEYGFDAKLVFVGQNQQPSAEAWQLLLSDHTDSAGALGYHQSVKGRPWGIVGVQDDLDAGAKASVTVSHELLELMANPRVNRVVIHEKASGPFGTRGMMLAYEIADAPEGDQFAYPITAGGVAVPVSDFVLDAWFGQSEGDKFDFMGYVKQPLDILPGGYIGARPFRGASDWSQITGAQDPTFYDWNIWELPPHANIHAAAHVSQAVRQPQSKIPKFSRRWRLLNTAT